MFMRSLRSQGHVLVDVSFPLFESVRDWKAPPLDFNIIVLFEPRLSSYSNDSKARALAQLQLLSRQPLLQLPDMAPDGSPVCFEELIVGHRWTGARGTEILVGSYNAFSDFVAAVNTPLIALPSPTFCSAVLIERDRSSKEKRFLLNLGEVITTIRETTACVPTVLWPEDLSPMEQYKVLRHASMLIGASGSGTHNAAFMRPDTVVIDLLHPFHGWANSFVCDSYTRILCLQVNTSVTLPSEFRDTDLTHYKRNTTLAWVLRTIPMRVNLSHLQSQLQAAAKFLKI